MHPKKIVAFIILGLTATQVDAVPTSKIEEQRLEEEILKADHETLGNERSKKSVLLLNNQLPTITSSQTYNLPLQQTLGLQPSSQTLETLIQPNSQILNVQSAPRTLETVNLLPNGQPLVNIQSLPQTVETVSIQPNAQPAQLLNIQSGPRTVETVSVQQPVQTVNLLPNAQPVVNIQSLPQTVETVSIQQQQQQPVQTISVQPNAQPVVNIQSLPQTVETVSIQKPQLQALNLQAGGQTLSVFPQPTVIAQPPLPAQTNVNIVPQSPSVSVKEVQVESLALSSPSSVVERITQGFVNPLDEKVIVSPSLNELSLVPASGEQVLVSPSTSFFTMVKPVETTSYVNVPQVYYNPRSLTSNRLVSRVL
ncbi:uncharacterized protein LOC105735488 [Apis florea]|uniref:uncharacterized protein LOC105735488 n=1 Tax=Apis florea TaxID=7463 RepID=UPI0012FEC627|nr:uncharacterized protein LOC105735488 [Apis florea]